jgi:valyl-tRNA synthetase
LLWHFLWHEFCDWYLELKKLRFQEGSGLTDGWRNTLAAFEGALRLLHPAMPFLTEELWQRLVRGGDGDARRPLPDGRGSVQGGDGDAGPPLPDGRGSLALASYPQFRDRAVDEVAEREVGIVQEIVTLARTLRTESKLDPKQQLTGTLYSRDATLEVAQRHAEAIQKLANVKLEFQSGAAPKAPAIRSTAEFDLVLEVPKSQEDAQRKRVEKEREQLEKNIANSRRQLSDEVFLSKAPPKVVDTVRAKLADYETQLAKLS